MSAASPKGEPHGWGELRGHRQALYTKPSPFGRGFFDLKQLLGTRDEVPGKQQVLNTVPCPEKGGIYYVHY